MTTFVAGLRRLGVRLVHLMRDAWLIAGVTLLLIVALEGAYRVQASVRGGSRWEQPNVLPGPASPFDTTSWAREYMRDHAREGLVEWKEYVYTRNPTFTGTHISVDSVGHRVTPQPSSAGSRVVRLFFLGGSTAFGWYQRNEETIAAEAARQLQKALGSSVRVEVTNFGVPGHVFTQEMLTLILQLRAGARPDIVVFYDGINDVASTVQNGVAGIPQNESNRRADFARGRQLAADTGGEFATIFGSRDARLCRCWAGLNS